ncbi:MAG: DNA polymerase III subunit delta [Bacteroidetes bacterium]|nr:DNA polymerase III subunit delta [Bacteroidota bacterium]
MFFKDIVGQKTIIADLIKESASGKTAHAKTFVGSPGFGTLPVALAYSRYLLCEQPGPTDACGICSSCVQMNDLQHPDLHCVFPVVQSISKTSDGLINEWRDLVKQSPYFSSFDWLKVMDEKERNPIIGVEESKEIIKKINLKSFQGGFKVVIIFGSEQMNAECSNKLLKVLEEPPLKTLFLLLAEQQLEVLPTVQSRTQITIFPRLQPIEIAGYLMEKYSIDRQTADGLASFSDGDLSTATNLLKNGEMMDGYRESFIQLMRSCFKKNVNEMMSWAEEMSTFSKERQKLFLSYALHMLRQCNVLNYLGVEHVTLTPKEFAFSEKFSPYITGNNIRQFIETMDTAYFGLERNASAKMLFTELSFQVMRHIHRA